MKLIANLGIAIIAVLAPIKAALITVFVLIIIDLITGVLAALKRKEKIVSSGLRRTIVKLFLYELALIIGFLAEKYLISGVIPVNNIISAFIGLVELKSVLENMNEIGGGNMFSELLSKLGSPNDSKQ